jgi:predicted nucleic acid-binding Zn ribbon protein
MSKHNEHTLKDAIERLLKVYKLDSKLDENKLIASWENIMGRMIAKHTTDIFIKNKVLYVKFDSAALRSELSISKSKVIELLNKEAGKEILIDAVFK